MLNAGAKPAPRAVAVVGTVGGWGEGRGHEPGKGAQLLRGVPSLNPLCLLPMLPLSHTLSVSLSPSPSVSLSRPLPLSISPYLSPYTPLFVYPCFPLSLHPPSTNPFTRQELQKKDLEMARQKEEKCGGVGGGSEGSGQPELDGGQPFEAPGDDESAVRGLSLVPAGTITIVPASAVAIVVCEYSTRCSRASEVTVVPAGAVTVVTLQVRYGSRCTRG